MTRLARAAGEGTLAGSVAGATYGGWEILLQADLHHRFYRLAAERLALGTLEGALAGALLSLLLLAALRGFRMAGDRALRFGSALLIILYIALVAVAAVPCREVFFPHHRFSGNALSVAVFAALALTVGALLATRIREAIVPQIGRERGSPRVFSALGWLATCAALISWLVIPRLPLARGVTGKSVILVSLDTLRADRVGAYGCARPLTPHLDAIARQGIVFEQATAASPWTLTSHAALFTSLLPFTSGARNEHRYPAPGLAMLAERFRNAGYRTAAFTGGGYVFSGLGFDQGFEIYQDHDEMLEGGPGGIVSAALRWIRSMRGRPFFAFVHTYATHFPYRHTEFTDPRSALHDRVFEQADLDDVQMRGRVLTPEERRQIKDLYDGGVAFVDRVIGGMLESLEKEGLLDSVVLVILSDHGEDLWDHDAIGSPGHGHSLYQELLHVPLIVRAPGLVVAGARVRTPVSLLDVLPTLRELLGLPLAAPEEGRSLAESLRTGKEPQALPILSESTEYGPDRFARREGRSKVIVAPRPDLRLGVMPISARPLEVFDLAADPGETRSLPATATPDAAASTEALWKRVTAVFAPAREAEASDTIPKELREQLRSLGYIK